jgi:hypothetical protein
MESQLRLRILVFHDYHQRIIHIPSIAVVLLIALSFSTQAQAAETTLLRLPDERLLGETNLYLYSSTGIWNKQTGAYLGQLPKDPAQGHFHASEKRLFYTDQEAIVAFSPTGNPLSTYRFQPVPKNADTLLYHPQITDEQFLTFHRHPTLKHISPQGKVLGSFIFPPYSPHTQLKVTPTALEIWQHDEEPTVKLDQHSLKPLYIRSSTFSPIQSSFPDTTAHPAFSGGGWQASLTQSPHTGYYIWGLDETFNLHDPFTKNVVQRFALSGPSAISSWLVQGESLIVARQNTLTPNLERWNWRKQKRLQRWNGSGSAIVEIKQVDNYIVGISAKHLNLYRLEHAAPLYVLPLHPFEILSSFSVKGQTLSLKLARPSTEREVRLTSTGELLHQDETVTIAQQNQLPEDKPWYQPHTQRLLYSQGHNYTIWDMRTRQTWSVAPSFHPEYLAKINYWQKDRVLFSLPERSQGTVADSAAEIPTMLPLRIHQEMDIARNTVTNTYQSAQTFHACGGNEQWVFVAQDNYSRFSPEQGHATTVYFPQKSSLRHVHCHDNQAWLGIGLHNQYTQWHHLSPTGHTRLPDIELPPQARLLAWARQPLHQPQPEAAYLAWGQEPWFLPKHPIVPKYCQQSGAQLMCHGVSPQSASTYLLDLAKAPLQWRPYLDNPPPEMGIPLLGNFHVFVYGPQAQYAVALYLSPERIPLWITDQGYHWSPRPLNRLPEILVNGKWQTLPQQLANSEEVHRALANQPPLNSSGFQIPLAQHALMRLQNES